MFKHQGMWLPDGEAHFPDWMTKNGEIVDGRGTYQIKKFRAAMEVVRDFRVAVDVGAHVGFWALQMIKHFDVVECFEPVAEFRDCLIKNLPADDPKGERGAWMLHPVALGAAPGRVAMAIPALAGGIDTGGTHVNTAIAGEIEMRTLDSYEFDNVDFVKLDCEGYEHHVLEGARETLLRCRPAVIVEQKPHKLGPNFGIKGTPAVDLLRSLGAKVVREISGDYIMTF